MKGGRLIRQLLPENLLLAIGGGLGARADEGGGARAASRAPRDVSTRAPESRGATQLLARRRTQPCTVGSDAPFAGFVLPLRHRQMLALVHSSQNLYCVSRWSVERPIRRRYYLANCGIADFNCNPAELGTPPQ